MFDDTKIKVKPQKIFLEMLKSNGDSCIITGDIEECSINNQPRIIIELNHISRYELDIHTSKVSKCSKCDGTGITWNI